ncbi:hypothetical protein Tco_0441635 [Tanacetum coccineum]
MIIHRITPAEILRDLDQQMEKRADDGKANVVTDALSRKERVKPRRVRAMAMIIQYGVRGMILAAQSEAFKQENGMMRTVVMDEAHASRLRWMIYLVVLADAAESVRDTIGFEYCLASSSGWTKSPVLWAEIGESSLTGPELVLDMTDKVVLIKEKLKAARDRQKSYADNRRKPLEFEVGDRVMLKVSPWKGVIRFGKKGKLAPRYVGPFEILERVGPVAYRLRLPEELSGIKVDKTLRFVEEPVENSDREVKRLKCSRMVVVKAKLLAVRYLVKVSWNSKCNFELTWVWEDYLKDKYPRLIVCERDRLIVVDRGTRSVPLFVDSERDRLIVVDHGTRSVPLFVDSERDRLIVVDRGTRSVPLFVMLSVTVSIWFGVFALPILPFPSVDSHENLLLLLENGVGGIHKGADDGVSEGNYCQVENAKLGVGLISLVVLNLTSSVALASSETLAELCA